MERGGSLKLHQIGLKVLASKIVEDLVDLYIRGHVLEEQRRQLIERHHLHQVVHVARYRCTTQKIISLRLKHQISLFMFKNTIGYTVLLYLLLKDGYMVRVLNVLIKIVSTNLSYTSHISFCTVYTQVEVLLSLLNTK